MVVVVTRCYVVMGGGRHKMAIDATTVSSVEPDTCATDVWVKACPSDADACVRSSDDINLSGFISPPSSSTCPFPVVVDV